MGPQIASINLTKANVEIALCLQQVQPHPLSVDQDNAAADQVLAGAIVLLIAQQCLERHDKLHRFAVGLSRLVDRGAQIDTFELRFVMEILGHWTQKVGNVVVKGQSSNAVPRGNNYGAARAAIEWRGQPGAASYGSWALDPRRHASLCGS